MNKKAARTSTSLRTSMNAQSYPWDNEDSGWFMPIWAIGHSSKARDGQAKREVFVCSLGDEWSYSGRTAEEVKAFAWMHLVGHHYCGEINWWTREYKKNGKSRREAVRLARAMVFDTTVIRGSGNR